MRSPGAGKKTDRSMNPTDALRWLAHEAQRCRDRDTCEALCLLFPPLLRSLDLPPMGEVEAEAFRHRLKETLQNDLRRAA
jgi:hypothetical protein